MFHINVIILSYHKLFLLPTFIRLCMNYKVGVNTACFCLFHHWKLRNMMDHLVILHRLSALMQSFDDLVRVYYHLYLLGIHVYG